ncbi:hypothetical protein PV682_37885 [Streptomyces niveiscabiei]|uniref:hypothetical protein n=1 Tax=Streptomyces niveiscabiei TaxID=164115 RepID=UPI0029B078CD|nr:hypothetical protein [Streptomyces niveiscabiei]MDX3387174.1 hypothetical protein [Streptomyces niveiscabiei]
MHATTAPDSTAFRDLNGNGRMDPYEDPRLSPEERTEDLLSRLSLDQQVAHQRGDRRQGDEPLQRAPHR